MRQKKQETIELRGQKWLVVSKIEFWLGVLPAIFAVGIIVLSLLFLHPAAGIVLGPVIFTFYAPLTYIAWIIAIIDFAAVWRVSQCRRELKIRLIGFLLPVSIILLGISSMALTRGNFFYAMLAAAVAGVVRICFRVVSRRTDFKAPTIKVLMVILGVLLASSVVVTVGGELHYLLDTVPRMREDVNQQQEKWRQKMEQTIQPMLDEGMSETFAQMSYAYCDSGSEILKIVDNNHALLKCNDGNKRAIYELAVIDDDKALFMGFGTMPDFSDLKNALVLWDYNFETDTRYMTLLLDVQSEQDLLDQYGNSIVEVLNKYNFSSARVKVFYTSGIDLRDIDLATLAFMSQDRKFGMDDNMPREWSTGLKTFEFAPMQKSAVMEQSSSNRSVVVSDALKNRHLEINLEKREVLTVENLAKYWRAW